MDNPDDIEAYSNRAKQMRRHSAIEMGSTRKLPIESDHKIEFITELELV